MRVLHVQKVSGLGGSERHLLSLLPALKERGIEARLCILASQDHLRFADLAAGAGIEVTSIPAGPHVDPRVIPSIARVIKGVSADLVHTHLIHADFYGQLAAARLRVPGVISFHSTNPFFRKPLYRAAEHLSVKLSRRTIAISEHVRRFVEELSLGPSEKTKVIHYGIDAEGWLANDREAEAARADIGAGPQDVIVGVASRLFPHKGHDLLIEAFAGVMTEAPRARLYIAGDGPVMGELLTAAQRRLAPGSYRFLGHVEDIKSFMSACDVIVFPTLPGYGEGFGLAALEAMCAGKPVVATRFDSLPEVVVDGVTGILVPPGDAGALASALVTLCSEEERRLRAGAAGRSRAISDFSLKRMVDQTIDVYSEVV